MSLKDMKLEELELLSYTDLTYKILKEEKKALNTPAIFRIICDLLGYSESDFEEKIGDYYTSLTIDKRFIMLDTAEWDLRENHAANINLEEETVDEEAEEVESEEEAEEELDVEDDSLESTIEDDLEDSDDDMDDLSVLSEDELEDEE